MTTFLRTFLHYVSTAALCLCTLFMGVAETPLELNLTKAPPSLYQPQDSTVPAPAKAQRPVQRISPESVQDTVLPPCDIIFYKSGKLEYCKIIETSPETVSYKMCDYVDGPTVIVNKSDLHKIRYANGREEIIDVNTRNSNRNAYVKARKDPLSTLSMIFGIAGMGLLFLVGFYIPVLFIASVVLGIISLIKIERRKGELRGRGAAWIGIGLSVLATILLIVLTQ